MTDINIEELNKSVGTALSAFNEYKGMVEGFDKKLKEFGPKMDAFDQAKLTKINEDIGKAIEGQQALNGKLAAIEASQKALETAFNRVPQPGSDVDEKKSRKKMNKLFNDFARIPEDADQAKVHFHTYAATKAKDDPELKALSVNSDPNGGYLVQPEFGGVIQARVFETSPMRQLATVTTVGTDSYEMILDNDEAAASWVGETASRPTTNTPTLGKLTIPVNEMYAFPKASEKVLQDAMLDMEAWLAQKVAEIFGRTEATAFITGNGVNKPKGIMSYDAGTTLASQQIEQVNAGSTTDFTYDGLVNLQNALKEPYQANARFLMRRASNASVMKIKDGEGRPIFNMTYDKNTGLEPTIMGKPVSFAADVAAIASAALAAAYGDFRRAYQIVDRIGIRVLRDPFTDKPNVGFYTTKRVGGAVVNFEAFKIQKMSA